jgi:hypothetical protein
MAAMAAGARQYPRRTPEYFRGASRCSPLPGRAGVRAGAQNRRVLRREDDDVENVQARVLQHLAGAGSSRYCRAQGGVRRVIPTDPRRVQAVHRGEAQRAGAGLGKEPVLRAAPRGGAAEQGAGACGVAQLDGLLEQRQERSSRRALAAGLRTAVG